jgi:hypothetical protein
MTLTSEGNVANTPSGDVVPVLVTASDWLAMESVDWCRPANRSGKSSWPDIARSLCLGVYESAVEVFGKL